MLALADVSAAETKKIKVVDVVAAAAGTLPDGTIHGDTIINGSISGGKLEETVLPAVSWRLIVSIRFTSLTVLSPMTSWLVALQATSLKTEQLVLTS